MDVRCALGSETGTQYSQATQLIAGKPSKAWPGAVFVMNRKNSTCREHGTWFRYGFAAAQLRFLISSLDFVAFGAVIHQNST